MRDTSVLRRRGFTLIELMVVVTIIAILAALIVPALQRAQAAAMSRQCMSRIRSIAATIRAYASNWDNWTNGDRDHFVKDFGYLLSSEDGYVAADTAYNWISNTTSETYQRQQRVGDFRCPVDEGPPPNRHGIPCSYKVSSSFAGQNLANLQGESNKILAVSEQGKRHPIPGGGDGLERHFVMSDLSTTLGYRGNLLSGIYVRIWHRNSDAGIRNVPESALPDADAEDEAAGFFLNSTWSYPLVASSGVTSVDWTANGGPYGGHGWWNASTGHGGVASYCPRYLVARADGLIRFPGDGNIDINCVSHTNCYQYFGVGPEGVTNNESTTYTWVQKNWNQWNLATTLGTPVKGNVIYPIQAIYTVTDWWGGARWYYEWQYPSGTGGYQFIPNTAFYRMP